jgi:hypothetical protein
LKKDEMQYTTSDESGIKPTLLNWWLEFDRVEGERLDGSGEPISCLFKLENFCFWS